MVDPAWIARFESLGPDGVELLLASKEGLSGGMRIHALEWLAAHKRDERSRNDASQAEQMEIARSAARAASDAAVAANRAAAAAERQAEEASKANTKARNALAIAIVSIIVTAISIVVTHFDALHK